MRYTISICVWLDGVQKQITQKKENNGESLRNHVVSSVHHYSCYTVLKPVYTTPIVHTGEEWLE